MFALDLAAGARRTVSTTLAKRRRLRLGVLLVGYVSSGLLVATALLSDWSARAPRAHRGPWLLVLSIGIAIGSLTLYGMLKTVRQRLEADSAVAPAEDEGMQGLRPWQHGLALGLVAYLPVAGALILLAVESSSGRLALGGAWVGAAGLTVVTASLSQGLEEARSRRPRWVSRVTLDGLLLAAAAVVLGLRFSQTDWVLVFASLVGLLAISMMSLGLLVLCKTKPSAWCALGLGVSVASAVVTVALWALNAPIAFFVPPVVLCVLGFVPLSRGVPKRIVSGQIKWDLWAVGTYSLVAAGLGGLLTMTLASREWLPASAIAVFILTAILATALVSETFQLVVALLLGSMLVFVVDVGPGPTETDPGPVAEARLVVFGDSYISGEGARQYFTGTNTAGGDECRRAPSSYAHLLSEELGLGLDFYACSGATTDDVAVATGGVPTQLQAFLDDESSRAEAGLEPIPIAAVLVSVGGNDAWFGTVGQACLGPGSCDVHRDTLFGNVADIVARIETVHREIRNAVGEAVPVVAMPYPLILTESGCESSMLFSSEHQFLFEFTDVLNSAVEVAAKRAGVNFFSPGITAFDPVYDPVTGRQIRRGHRICDQDQEGTSLGGTDAGLAVNVIDIQPKEGALADRLLPTNWLHGSAHPNEVGHRLTADALTDWLAGVEGNPSPEPWAERGKPPPGQRVVSTRLLGIPDVVLKPSELRIPGELPAPVAVDGLEAQASYALSSLRVGSFVYHSQPNGEWFQIGPTPDDGSAAVPAWDGGQLDCSAEAAPTNQVIIWQARDGGWSAEVRHYCGRSNGEIGAAPIAIPAQLNELQVPPADELPVSAAAEASELGSPYPVGTAMAGSFVYYSQPNGEWLSLGPIDAETASSVPGWGRETQIDFDADSMAPRQVILWKQRFTGNWHIVVRQYCELDPECPDSEDEIRAWTISQIGSTIRQGTVPVILLFVGFWSLAIHLAVGQHHRSSWGKRLFPWVPLPISKDNAPDTSAPLCP